jgi:hypothetical protein
MKLRIGCGMGWSRVTVTVEFVVREMGGVVVVAAAAALLTIVVLVTMGTALGQVPVTMEMMEMTGARVTT